MKTLLAILITAASLSACSNSSKAPEEKTAGLENVINSKSCFESTDNVNLIFLLDLSNRISNKIHPLINKSAIDRDKTVIKAVANGFFKHLGDKSVQDIDDRIRIAFEPQPQLENFDVIQSQLKKEFDNRTTLDQIKTSDSEFANAVDAVYASALKHGKFVGSNIWQFFKDKDENGLLKEGHRNVLVIFTDGYMYYTKDQRREGNKTNWIESKYLQSNGLTASNYQSVFESQKYGFIPATTGLENLEVAVVGIHNDNEKSDEKEVVKLYWRDWLSKMGVKKSCIVAYTANSNPEEVVINMLNNQSQPD